MRSVKKVVSLILNNYFHSNALLVSHTGLLYCDCSRVTPELRKDIVQTVLSYVNSRDKTQPLKFLSFGSGHLGIEYLIIQFLKLQGFKQIHMFAVDLMYKPVPSYETRRAALSRAVLGVLDDYFEDVDRKHGLCDSLINQLDAVANQLSGTLFTPMNPISFGKKIMQELKVFFRSESFASEFGYEARVLETCFFDTEILGKIHVYLTQTLADQFNTYTTSFFDKIDGLFLKKDSQLPKASDYRADIILKIDAPNDFSVDIYEQECFALPYKPLLYMDYGPHRLVNEY